MRRLAFWVAALLLAVGGAIAALPEPRGIAVCPKVEYRLVVRRGVVHRDTVTIIPEQCR